MAYIQATFRGVPFHAQRTNNEFGRRLVVHEYPQSDTPYAEDMGRKGRKFVINAFVIGADWEKKRDDLIKACEKNTIGLLVHPDYGEFNVKCEACNVTESKIEAGQKADFDLTFIESGNNIFPGNIKSTDTKVKDEATGSIKNLGDVFTKLNDLSNLPQTVTDYVFGQLEELTGVSNPYQLLTGYEALSNLLNGDITIPWQATTLISAFTSVFNADYSDNGTELSLLPELKATVTNVNTKDNRAKISAAADLYEVVDKPYSKRTDTITPRQAVKIYTDICKVEPKKCDKLSPSKIKQYTEGRRFELYTKGLCVIEASVASANIEFESIKEAQEVWTNVLEQYDQTIAIATEINDDKSFLELRKMRALFVADTQKRAPELGQIEYKDVIEATPALLLAYDFYGDINRESEIINRNHVRNPVLVKSPKLELLANG